MSNTYIFEGSPARTSVVIGGPFVDLSPYGITLPAVSIAIVPLKEPITSGTTVSCVSTVFKQSGTGEEKAFELLDLGWLRKLTGGMVDIPNPQVFDTFLRLLIVPSEATLQAYRQRKSGAVAASMSADTVTGNFTVTLRIGSGPTMVTEVCRLQGTLCEE